MTKLSSRFYEGLKKVSRSVFMDTSVPKKFSNKKQNVNLGSKGMNSEYDTVLYSSVLNSHTDFFRRVI